MSESLHQYVLDQLAARKGKWRLISEKSGISKRTIEKIASREIPNPGVQSVEALAHVFREEERRAS